MKNRFVENKLSLVNILTSFLLQILTIVSGFIIPKIILNYFGSDVNGLLSSIKQFLSYITIVEGGVSGIVIANLYKPLLEKDTKKINMILNTANSFYKKIGLIFIVYSFCLAIFYPIIIKESFDYGYVFLLVIISSITLLVQYLFSLTYRGLLTADKRIYIISLVQIMIVVINTVLTVIVSKIYPSIHLLKFLSGCAYIIQPILFGIYVKKHYIIDKKVDKDLSLLKERWNGFAINIASFIHNSTDITILSVFTNLTSVSIYSVYTLVTSGIKQLINSVASAITPTIGQAYAKHDTKELYFKLDLYEYIIDFLSFYVFSLALLLITPFVLIYTRGVTDANYNQPLFGFLLILSELIYILKLPHLNLAYSANKFKELTRPAFFEAIINIIISIVLVNKFGLVGVTIGTIIAMTYRLVFHINFTKKIIDRNQWFFYKKLIIFFATSLLGLFICNRFLFMTSISFINWLIYAFIYSLIFLSLFLLVSLIFFKKEFNFFLKYFNIRKY